jgi:benzoyl-CoA reductase subunit D
VLEESWEAALSDAGIETNDIAYIATTGEGELVEFRRGHFYGMTTHARGAIYLMPETRAVIDIGALHARAMKISDQSRVLSYRMTSQCASGSGQFLENVARYLGITLEDIGPLSCSASTPEMVSSICAVLAETDVINMVSRGIKTGDILKGIHLSMAGRYVKLLRAVGAEGTVAITGGLAADSGLAKAVREKIAEDGLSLEVITHPMSIYAGAIGAALWGAYRHRVLAKRRVEVS